MMSGTAAYCCRSVHHQVAKQYGRKMFFAGAGAAVIPFSWLGVRPVSTAALQSPDALFHGADRLGW